MKKLELERLAIDREAQEFAEAVRHGEHRDAVAGDFTASGLKDSGPALGTDRFTASGDGKAVAGTRAPLSAGDFTATGNGKGG